jgi:hypothetical protein
MGMGMEWRLSPPRDPTHCEPFVSSNKKMDMDRLVFSVCAGEVAAVVAALPGSDDAAFATALAAAAACHQDNILDLLLDHIAETAETAETTDGLLLGALVTCLPQADDRTGVVLARRMSQGRAAVSVPVVKGIRDGDGVCGPCTTAETLMLDLVSRNMTRTLEVLVRKNVMRVDVPTTAGEWALMHATTPTMVRTLVRLGLVVAATGADGALVLMNAIHGQNLPLIRELVRHGVCNADEGRWSLVRFAWAGIVG